METYHIIPAIGHMNLAFLKAARNIITTGNWDGKVTPPKDQHGYGHAGKPRIPPSGTTSDVPIHSPMVKEGTKPQMKPSTGTKPSGNTTPKIEPQGQGGPEQQQPKKESPKQPSSNDDIEG